MDKLSNKEFLGVEDLRSLSSSDVIKVMFNKISRNLFNDMHFDDDVTSVFYSGGIEYGTNINRMLLTENKYNSTTFSSIVGVNSNIHGTIGVNNFNLTNKVVFNEHMIKRAMDSEYGLQELYNKLISNMRVSIAKQRKDKFINVIENFIQNKDLEGNSLDFQFALKVVTTPKGDLPYNASLVKESFSLPSDVYNPRHLETQCFMSDIIAIAPKEILAKAKSNIVTPFTDWLIYNSIRVDTIKNQVFNGSTVAGTGNLDLILMDKRLANIFINVSKFTSVLNPDTLNIEIYYNENITIETNPFSNICLFKGE